MWKPLSKTISISVWTTHFSPHHISRTLSLHSSFYPFSSSQLLLRGIHSRKEPEAPVLAPAAAVSDTTSKTSTEVDPFSTLSEKYLTNEEGRQILNFLEAFSREQGLKIFPKGFRCQKNPEIFRWETPWWFFENLRLYLWDPEHFPKIRPIWRLFSRLLKTIDDENIVKNLSAHQLSLWLVARGFCRDPDLIGCINGSELVKNLCSGDFSEGNELRKYFTEKQLKKMRKLLQLQMKLQPTAESIDDRVQKIVKPPSNLDVSIDLSKTESCLRKPVVEIGSFCAQGKRSLMEDRHQIVYQPENPNVVLLAGVFDGHGGEMTSDYLQTHLIKKIDEKLSRPNDKMNLWSSSERILLSKNYEAWRVSDSLTHPYGITEKCRTGFDKFVYSSLISSFFEVDSEVSQLGSSGWSTALVVALYKQPSPASAMTLLGFGSCVPQKTSSESPAESLEGEIEFRLMVAGTGDSFAIMGIFDGSPQQENDHNPLRCIILQRDHKPNDPNELLRIEKSKGYVTFSDRPRLCHNLATSRAFNDNKLKSRGLIADPDILCFPLKSLCQTPFIVIGSSGLLESFSYRNIADFVARGYLEGKSATLVSSELVKAAEVQSDENMTAVVIYLNPPPVLFQQ